MLENEGDALPEADASRLAKGFGSSETGGGLTAEVPATIGGLTLEGFELPGFCSLVWILTGRCFAGVEVTASDSFWATFGAGCFSCGGVACGARNTFLHLTHLPFFPAKWSGTANL